MATDSFDAVIVGAGLGGLASALALAGTGHRVALVEAADEVGGKVRVARVDGHEIDCGPTVLTMRPVFEELFATAGLRLEDHVQLHRLELLARHAWPDGARLDLFADDERSAAAIEAFAGASAADGYRRFVRYAATLLDRLDAPFMRHDNDGLVRMMLRVGPRGLLGLARVDFARSMWQALGDFFPDPRLRQLFGRYATYYGSSPFSAPATLNLIAAVEQRGVWAVQGGMIVLARAIAAAFLARGGTLVTGQAVTELEGEGRRVAAVRLADGTRLACRHVVFNGDPSRLCGGHLGDAVRAAVAPVVAPPSLSAMTWSMLARPRGLPLGYHTVCFGDDYADEFAALFERGRVPTRPTVYLCAPDRVSGIPEGDERLFCLINAPAGLPRDDEGEATCRAAMEQSLRACGLELHPSRPAIAAAPAHFAERFPGTAGAIYGAATHGALAAFRRPAITTRVPNLWLVGGASHPGAGLPMVTLGGLWASRRIAADLASTRTSAPVATSGGTSTASTRAATTPSP